MADRCVVYVFMLTAKDSQEHKVYQKLYVDIVEVTITREC